MLLNMKPFMKGYRRDILFIKRHLYPFIQKSAERKRHKTNPSTFKNFKQHIFLFNLSSRTSMRTLKS